MRKAIDIWRNAESNAEKMKSLAVVDDSRPGDNLLIDRVPMHRMVTFRYSMSEVSMQDGGVHMRMKQTDYKDGRLRTEECEGTIDRQAYDRMVLQAQGQFLNQAFGVARLLLAPFLAGPRRKD